MNLTLHYQDNTLRVENDAFATAPTTATLDVPANSTKGEIIALFRRACRMPDYLWESWDSFRDCLLDYSAANPGGLSVRVALADGGIGGDLETLLGCLVGAMLYGQPCQLVLTAASYLGLTDAQRIVAQTIEDEDMVRFA